MVTTDWTHPKHKIPAAVALVFNLIACLLVLASVTVTPWFCNRRSKQTHCYFVHSRNIECSYEVCKPVLKGNRQEDAWQDFVEYTWMLGMVTTCVASLLQLLFFWPMTFFRKVINILLRVVYVLEFISGFLMALACFSAFYYSIKINHSYAWFKPNAVVQMDPLPGGLGLFSMIFSFLSGMMLLVATDVGPRNGEPYVETLRKEQEVQERMARLSRMPSQFVPPTASGHMPRSHSTGSTEL